MFVSGPGSYFQPFLGFPAQAFVPFQDDGGYPQSQRNPSSYGFYTTPGTRPPQRNRRQGGGPAASQYQPRYAGVLAPWGRTTPGRHFHAPDIVYVNDDDSAEEEEEEEYDNCTQLPPHTPVQHHHPYASRPASSNSSSSRRAQQSQHSSQLRQPTSWADAFLRQASPFAAQQQAQHNTTCESDQDDNDDDDLVAARDAHSINRAFHATHPHLQHQHQQRLRQQQQHQHQQQQARQQQQVRQQQAAKAKQAMAEAEAAAEAAAAAAASPQATYHKHKGLRHIPVRVNTTQPAQQQQQKQQVKQVPTAAAAAAGRAAPQAHHRRRSRSLSKVEAATIIQSWWRMRRLARQQPALHVLMAAASQLRAVAAKFDAYKAEASGDGAAAASQGPAAGYISHKQYLQLNELAMRVLLELDCTPCGVPELRAVRKRLAASTVALLDSIQAAFSATVTASMEVPDSVVDQALQQQQQQQVAPPGPADSGVGAGAAAAAADSVQVEDEDEDEGEDQACAALLTTLQSGALLEATDMMEGTDDTDSNTDCPVRVVLRVAGQCCDAGTQTD